MKTLGIDMHSYGMQWAKAKQNPAGARFHDPLTFLEYAHRLGAGGVQVGIGIQDQEYCRKIRNLTERTGTYIEGQVSLPSAESGLERFEAELVSAERAGATIIRTAMLGGRRYETFNSVAEFREFSASAWKALVRAEPIARKNRVKIAIENHKDWLIPELLEIIRKISGEWVGICVDTGNSIALLEDPMEVVNAYAPFALSTHLKDMAVKDYEDGFLLSEIPLGTGILDIKEIRTRLETANPQIRWNLEMITRDPLRVPILKEKYWATFEKMPASQLAKAVGFIREKGAPQPLPQITGRSDEEKLKIEDDNVRQSLDYARSSLGL